MHFYSTYDDFLSGNDILKGNFVYRKSTTSLNENEGNKIQQQIQLITDAVKSFTFKEQKNIHNFICN